MYRPAILSARTITTFPVGESTATLLGDVEPAGLIRYGYVMEFCDPQGVPCFYVAAEENAMNSVLGGGSHFLCSYIGGTHRNHGCSDEWTDVEKFTQRAVEMYHQEFG